MTKERLKYLFERYAAGTCTPQERQELAVLGLVPDNEMEIGALLEALWEQTPLTEQMPDVPAALIFNSIMERHPALIVPKPRKVIRFSRAGIAVAASIIILIGIGIFTFLTGKKSAVVSPSPPGVIHDIQAPATNRASILLANGSIIYLDSAANGIITNQGNVQLVKKADGSIAYDGAASKIVYNTLTNPRGSKVIHITFSDGTRVWLNAGSSITYPMVFVGQERKVTVTGEAYFDVAHHATMPFRVCKGNLEVTVLGTQFNVNAYDDEDAVKVTLLKGSVKIIRHAHHSQAVVIKPGQQAVVNDTINVDDNIDLEEVMAWKNGIFQFGDKIDIQSLMRQVARWYDVEIEYQGNVNGMVGGSISRDVNISKVMEMLEKTGVVKFKIDGKKITVMK